MSVRFAAISAGLPVRSVQGILEGHIPSIERAAEVASALGLEFYVGPPRDIPSDKSEDSPPAWARSIIAQQKQIISHLPASEPIMMVAEDSPDYGLGNAMAPFARNVRAAAGSGEIVFEEATEFRFAFPRSILPKWINPENLVCISARGDSMESAISDGDLILLDYSRQDPLDGQMFVIRGENGLAVKRLKGRGFEWVLASDNQAYPSRPVVREDQLIGQVAWTGPSLDRKN